MNAADGALPDSLPRCISNKCVSDKCASHGQKCIACDESCGRSRHPGCSFSVCTSGLCTQNAIAKPRYSAAVNATPPVMCISSLFLFRDASPSLFVQTNREYRAQPAANSSGRVTRARSARRTYHPASVFFSSSIILFARYGPDIPTISILLHFFLAFERVYTCETKGFSSRYTKPREFFY